MQNTTTQPQNFMTKPGMPLKAPRLDSGQPENGKKKRKLPKRIFAVVGLVVFVIVAVMGVLIAQKQVAQKGEDVKPVAPTAPTSKPAASTWEPNNCGVKFSVTGPQGICDNKTALTDFTANGGKEITDGKFNVGDEFVFRITVTQPINGQAENIVVNDTLPTSLTFVEAYNSPDYTLENNGQKITATIPKMDKGDVVNIEFKVMVNSTKFGSQTNTAYIQGSKNNSCTYNFTTVKGVTECVSKKLYDLKGKLIANGGALTRGQQYEYQITVSTKNRSQGEVKLIDYLPQELELVSIDPESQKYIVGVPNSEELVANFGTMEDEEITLKFIMKVPEDIEPTTLKNLAKVYTFPKNSKMPEPPANTSDCSVKHTILPIGTAKCASKQAFRIDDPNNPVAGQEITPGAIVRPGETILYRITVQAENTTDGQVVLVDKLPADIKFIQDPINTPGLKESPKGTITIDLEQMKTGQEKVVEFLAQVVAKPKSNVFKNVATVVTNNTEEHSCKLVTKLKKEYSCNTECTSDANCQEIGPEYACLTTSDGSDKCRLKSNPTSTSCQAPTPTPTPKVTPTPTPTPTPKATPTPTPAPGCDDLCVSNSDCSNPAHICTTTADGSNRCRLADYVDSATCTKPAQPTLPPELPKTGPEDWLNWLKAGMVTLGIGTALFLIL